MSMGAFYMGQDVCVSLLLARGRHCYVGRAIRWALSRISSLFIFLHLFISRRLDDTTNMKQRFVTGVLS